MASAATEALPPLPTSKFLGLCANVLRFVVAEPSGTYRTSQPELVSTVVYWLVCWFPSAGNASKAAFQFALRFDPQNGAWHDEPCVVAMQQCCTVLVQKRQEAAKDKGKPAADKRSDQGVLIFGL